jgi:hypothetical protein
MRLRSRDGVLQSLSDRVVLDRQQARNASDASQRDVASSRVAFLLPILDSFDQCDDELEQLAQSFLISQVIQDQGKTAQRLLEEMSALAKTMQRAPDMRLKSMGATLGSLYCHWIVLLSGRSISIPLARWPSKWAQYHF